MKIVFASARLAVLSLAWAAAFASWAQTQHKELVVAAPHFAQPAPDRVAETSLSGWTVGGALQFFDTRFDDDCLDNATVLDGYTLVGLSASTHLAHSTFQTANTFASAGRLVYVGMSWSAR